MILKINLAPDFTLEPSFRDLALPIFVLLAVIAVTYYGPTIYADSIRAEAQEITTKTAEKRQQLAALETDLNKAKALQSMVNELQARKGVIEGIANGRRQAVAVLEKLQEIHLERMWITNLEFKQNVIAMKGWAIDHNVISEYVRRIKTTNNADDVSGIDTKTFTPTFKESSQQSTASKSGNAATTGLSSVKFTDIVLKESTTKENTEASNMPIQNFDLQFNPNLEPR